MSTLDHIWPSDYARSLWNYGALQQPRNIPFMGYDFSNEFFLALAGGAVIIVMFALRRFNTHSTNTDSNGVRALRELKPMDLRAGALMSQAYFRYVGVLLVIYLALTLFGSLIFQAINQLPAVAGLQVDTRNVDYKSPQWPLMIGLGIAGFVPMLKPVELVERRLRAWAHRSAGIPIRITEQTNRIKKALDSLTGPAPEFDQAPAWLGGIAPESEQKRAFKTRAQLRYLLDWSKDQRAYWPSAHARSILKELEAEETRAAFLTMEAFDDLLIESYDRVTGDEAGVNPAPEIAEASAAVHGQGMTSSDGRMLSYATGARDALLRHRRRLEREWNDLTARMEVSRDELASMLAIFVEHDNRIENIGNPQLKEVVDKARSQRNKEEDPTFWLFLALIPVLVIYWIAIFNEQHSLLTNFEKTGLTITLSALVNLMKTAIHFCVPVSIVLGWRYMLRENERWVLIDVLKMNRTMMRQLLRASTIAAVAAIMLLALLGLLWAAIISRTEEQFQALYIGSASGYLPILVSQFLISVATTVVTLIAVDFVQIYRPRSVLPLIPLGILNTALVLLLWAAHVNAFWGFKFCEADGTAYRVIKELLLKGPTTVCYQIYEGTDLYVNAVLAFCSASFFIPLGPTKRSFFAQLSGLIGQGGARLWTLMTGAKTTLFLVLCFTIAGPQPLTAQEVAPEREVVHLGFRDDAQPFSYFDEDEQRYRGYLVDLCLRIFDGRKSTSGGPDYDIVIVPVTVKTRFNAFKKKPAEPMVDVLCDPVTIAFQPPDTLKDNDTGRDGGVFSPIVFASGVSYLSRRPEFVDGNFILSWVEGATAMLAAYRACRSDLFRLRPSGDDGCDPGVRSTVGAQAIESNNCKDLKIDETTSGPEGNRKYYFCTFASHTEAIDWFCSNETETDRAYFGDRDIIVAKLEGKIGQDGRNRNACPKVEPANETYTYEPYALVINKSRPDLIRFVQRRIYEIFSNRNEIAGIFSANFGGRQMTRSLASLFLLNAVEFNE